MFCSIEEFILHQNSASNINLKVNEKHRETVMQMNREYYRKETSFPLVSSYASQSIYTVDNTNLHTFVHIKNYAYVSTRISKRMLCVVKYCVCELDEERNLKRHLK